MIPPGELAAVLPELPRIRISGVYHRVLKSAYLTGPPPGLAAESPPQPLWPRGASERGARYTPIGGPNSLYLAPDPVTALAEIRAVLPPEMRSGGPHDPLTVLAVEVELPNVLDLCDRSIQRSLRTNRRELVSPWLRAQVRYRKGTGPLPMTQALGAAAAETGVILALRYPSARIAAARNLVVFIDHLQRLGGTLGTIDSSGQLLHRLP